MKIEDFFYLTKEKILEKHPELDKYSFKWFDFANYTDIFNKYFTEKRDIRGNMREITIDLDFVNELEDPKQINDIMFELANKIRKYRIYGEK